MKILVVGLLPFDSGKTEFILSLSEVIKDYGYDPGYFKPVGGHDGWYQYNTLIHSMDLGVLVGHDAYIVSEKLDLIEYIHIVSPLDILTLPIDPVKIGISIRTYMEYMESIGKKTVLVRYTQFIDKTFRHIYYICTDSLKRLTSDLNDVFSSLINSLRKNNSIFIETTTERVEKFLSNPILYSIIDQYLSILPKRDPLIIEGYNDVSAPTNGSLDNDYVFIIAPGKALIYQGNRYRTAVEFLSYRGYPWTIRVSTVIDLLGKPLNSFNIPLKFYEDKYYRVFEEIVGFILGKR